FVTIIWGLITLGRGGVRLSTVAVPPPIASVSGWWPLDAALTLLFGFGLALPVVGGSEVLARGAHELPPPRVQALRRTGLLTVIFTGVVTTVGTFLFVLLVPAGELPLWTNAPLPGLAQHLVGPSPLRVLLAVALAGAAVTVLGAAVHAALAD